MARLPALLFYFMCLRIEARSRLEIRRYELCPGTDGPIKYHANLTNNNKFSILNYNMSLPYPLDDQIGLKCEIQTLLRGTKYRTLHMISEKNFCKAANTYMGPLWHNITVAANIPPRKCPIATGQYQGTNVVLNLNELPFQTFPVGKLRFIINLVFNTNTKDSLLCLLQEIEKING